MKLLTAIRAWCGAHKKLTATLIALGVEALAKHLPLDPAQVDKIAGTIVVYILGQGMADIGKEKAKIEQGAAKGV